MKRLHRSTKDQKISGVIGGLGEYFGVDANVLRLGAVLLFFFTAGFPVLITYIAAWFILPEDSVPAEKESSQYMEPSPPSEPANSH